MILTLFLIGILAIIGIARYNEDDRLFWKLLLSFVFAFSVTTMCYKLMGDDNENNPTEQVCPTQVSYQSLDTNKCLFTSESDVIAVTDSIDLFVPVSKDNTPVLSGNIIVIRKGREGIRDQTPTVPNQQISKPPILNKEAIDSS